MNAVSSRVEKWTSRGWTEVPSDEVISGIFAGEIYTLRGCLQSVNFLDPILDELEHSIGLVVGNQRASAIRTQGFQSIHQNVSAKELIQIGHHLVERMTPLTMQMVKAVAKGILQVEDEIYIQESPGIRVFVPHEVATRHHEELEQWEKQRSRGSLTPHGPHLDSWLHHPMNTINIWTAVGPVKPLNGMTLFPHMFGRRLPEGDNSQVRSDQYYGAGFNLDMKPGDALIFHIDHLHGSELNQTNESRVVVSGRFTPGEPKLFDARWYNYLPSADVPEMIGKLTQPCSISVDRPKTPDFTDDTSAERPPAIATNQRGSKLEFQLDQLSMNEIRAVTTDLGVVRTPKGVFAFDRTCPHAGADLTLGFVQDGQIHCPSHNLAIDPCSGRSKCQSIPTLAMIPCTVKGSTVSLDPTYSVATPASPKRPWWSRLFGNAA